MADLDLGGGPLLAFSEDVVVQSLATIVVALIGAWAGARRSTRRAEAAAGEVQAQLTPNGGSSFRDLVDRRLTSHDERLDRMEVAANRRGHQLDEIAAVVHAINAHLETRPEQPAPVLQPEAVETP